jgi:YesN/AraC family two-component response regulator
MITYIKANYHLFDFSLQKMADQFNMPTSVISQYFKDYTDMNIVDYLAELRIHKAKELLINSQMDIKNISVEVGYYNVNSFIRRFKQIEGITPGDFRKDNAFSLQYSQKK